jgi:hypothetical protein
MKSILKPSGPSDFPDGRFVTMLSISSLKKASPDAPSVAQIQSIHLD